ncbi:MAG: MarR family transcriptional regulator [Microbacteriaceae bacterium]|jgi:DNA-binding MarR family transcriptional regulator
MTAEATISQPAEHAAERLRGGSGEHVDDAAWAVERLRLAESQLGRRRQAACGPSDTDRAAMRFLLEETDLGRLVTPGDLGEHLGIVSSSVTGLLERLRDGGLIETRAHPSDRRSKIVLPVDRNDDPESIDPLSAVIRSLATELTDEQAAGVARFLDRVAAAVDEECR